MTVGLDNLSSLEPEVAARLAEALGLVERPLRIAVQDERAGRVWRELVGLGGEVAEVDSSPMTHSWSSSMTHYLRPIRLGRRCSSVTYGPGLTEGAVFVMSGDDPRYVSSATGATAYSTFIATHETPPAFRIDDDPSPCA